MWEFIPEYVMLKNIYYLECRNRLQNLRYQNKSMKKKWQCYNDFHLSKTSIGWIWTSMHICKGKEKTVH